MKYLYKILFITLFVFFLVACFPKKINHLDCSWDIPRGMSQGNNGYYYSVNDSYSINFENTYEAPDPEYFTFLTKFEDRNLIIKKYQTNASSNIEMKAYVISRKNYEGTVLIINNDYKNFLVRCD